MRVLVFGATGYLGGAITRQLLGAGHEVTGFVRPASSAAVPPGAAEIRGTIDDDAALAEACRDIDAVVFAARLFGDGAARLEERRVVSRLLALLGGTGAAFVFTSGTGVLSTETGGNWDDAVFAEDDPFTPGELMTTRAGTEALVRASAATGVRGIVVRPPSIWGGGLSSHTTHVVRSVLERGAAWYVGPGLNSYSVVHVDDLAELYRLAVERGASGALYHATAGEVPNRWLAQTVGSVLDVPARSVTPAEAAELWGDYVTRVVMGSSSRTTSARTRAALGWNPQHTDMLADTRALLAELAADPAALAATLARRPV